MKTVTVKCEGCGKGPYPDLPVDWFQVGVSRFKNAQDGLAAWCKKCQPKAKAREGDPWRTYSRRVPKAVYDALLAAEEKLGRVYQVDISEGSSNRIGARVAVLEALAQDINDTDEYTLKARMIGL